MLDWLRELDDEQKAAAIKNAFCQVLDTESGRIVFATILEHLHVFRSIKTEEDRALNNYGLFLLQFLGDNPGDAEIRAIDALIRLPKKEQ